MALLATTSFQGPWPIEDNLPIKRVLKMTHYLTHPVYYSWGDLELIDFIQDKLTRDKHMWVIPIRWVGLRFRHLDACPYKITLAR